MRNELSKQKKKVGRKLLWASMFLQTLLFTALGLLFYVLVPESHISHVTEKVISCVVLIFLFVAFLAWKFWYKPASIKFFEEYRTANCPDKGEKMLSNRTFIIGICLIVFISFGISFWYFGHHRPAQEILNAEPVKTYKTVTPSKSKPQSPNTRAIAPSSHVGEETFVTPSVPDPENTNAYSSSEQSDLPENVKLNGDTPVSEGKEEEEHERSQSQSEQEASKQLKAEAKKALAAAKQIQQESLELMREAMPIIASHLNTLSTTEQIEMLRQVKTTMLSQVSQYPPELQTVIAESNIGEEGWQMYLDMLADYGYTPPSDFE